MRRICIFTSTRAEYGLLRGLIQSLAATENIQLQLLVSGSHLSSEFGLTIEEIRNDGFNPDENIEILLSSDTPQAICKSMGLALMGYGEALNRLRPDILIILGDRYEAFCAAASAQICRIPVGHIHGGEATEGLIDEAFRHSITKMAHLHFPSYEGYRRRIIQMGESPERVFNVGSLGVENIRKISILSREDLGKTIDLSLDGPFFLVTFHPVTLETTTSGEQIQALLNALNKFSGFNVIFTKANADTDGRIVNQMIDKYCDIHKESCFAVSSLGTQRYLSVMKLAELVIGNSSSGVIEAPSFKIPTINIGDRQKGRLRPLSVIDCLPKEKAIESAITLALSEKFRLSLKNMKNPYEKVGTAQAIKDVLRTFPMDGILKKTFYDLPITLTGNVEIGD